MRVALEFSRKLNMTVELIVDENGEWGDVYENWTGTGLVGNLIDDKGDIGFGKVPIFQLAFDTTFKDNRESL